MNIKETRSLVQQRANDGFFDASIKFSYLDDLPGVVDELEKGGYLLGMKTDDCLFVSWGSRSHFQDRWVDNLNDYMANQLLCCMCGNPSTELMERNNGDVYCKNCHESYCEHVNNETLIIHGGEITICHDCGIEL